MITMPMTDDIRRKEIKTIGPFTTRQAVCVLIGACIGVPVALIVPLSITARLIIGFVLALPPIICGYIKFAGMNLENFIALIIYRNFLTPKKRKKNTKIAFRQDMEAYDRAVEKKKTQGLTPSQLKAYEKRKAERQVQYSNKKEYRIYR